jgi:hypothetical protein
LLLDCGDAFLGLVSLSFLLEFLVFCGVVVKLVLLDGVLNFPRGNFLSIEIMVMPGELQLAPSDMLLSERDDPGFFFWGNRSFSFSARGLLSILEEPQVCSIEFPLPFMEGFGSDAEVAGGF